MMQQFGQKRNSIEVGTKILIPRSWYQKNREPERQSLSVARGGASPPPRAWGAGSPPEQQGVWAAAAPQQKQFYGGIFYKPNWIFYLKWPHLARYELILKLKGAIWLRIILKPLLTPKGAM